MEGTPDDMERLPPEPVPITSEASNRPIEACFRETRRS